MNRSARRSLYALAVFAAAGTLFSAVSTYDYIAHLDRQVHAITCSYVPGIGAADVSGSSGCHVTMMSPYSAVFRTWTWGGIPIALASLAVFAYLLFRAGDLLLRKVDDDPVETRFLVAGTLLPVVVSVAYFALSWFVIHAVCKLCVGIYVSSIGAFVAAARLSRATGRSAPDWNRYALYFGEGVAFVLVLVVLYVGLKPAYPAKLAACGELLHPEDKYGVRTRISAGAVPAIELLDPLCPACRGMSQRLRAGGFERKMALEAVLFPLDKDCNWMVHQSVHPGACAASEAVLCAGPALPVVLDWIFDHQSELHDLGRTTPAQVGARIVKQFPQLASCVGKPEVKAKLNRSLRWAVTNSLPVLTPQLFVGGQKICDEDTDLGLDYVLARTLDNPPVAGGSGRAAR